MKPKSEVIQDFNMQINMSVEELQAWLDDPKSKTAGTGVGLASGHKIVEILKKNPTKDPGLYDDEDLEHMRKVVGYNKRHMAQEDHLKETKSKEELENTKSTISMKNWGHDPVKTLDEEQVGGDAKPSGTVDAVPDATEKADDEEQTKTEPSVGDKRKLDETSPDVEPTNNDIPLPEATQEKDIAGEDESTKEGDGVGEGHVRKKTKTADEEVA